MSEMNTEGIKFYTILVLSIFTYLCHDSLKMC